MTDPRDPNNTGIQGRDPLRGTPPSQPSDYPKSQDQAKVGSTMETAGKAKQDAKATPGAKDNIIAEAKAQDVPQPGEDKGEHFGEAGPGVEEVGKDTVLEPGKNVGLQTVSAEAYNQVLDKQNKARQIQRTGRKRISDEQLDKMSPAEIRAVSHDRDYKLQPGGRRSLIRQFARAQKEDQTLDEPVKEEKKA